MRLIPFFVLSVLLTSAVIIGAAAVFCTVMEDSQIFKKASVAIVMGSDAPDDLTADEQDDSEASGGDLKTQLMISMVSQMSSVKSICDFNYLSRSEAASALKAGSVDVAIYLPNGIYESIDSGENKPVTLLLSDSAAALQQDIFSQLVAAGVSLIRTVENAIYTVDYVAQELPTVTELSEIEDTLFGLYVTSALNRTSVFSTEGTSVFGDLSMRQFYLITGTLLLFLIFGIGFGTFYTRSEQDVKAAIRRFGVPGAALDAARLIAATAVLTILTFAVLMAVRFGIPALSAAIRGGDAVSLLGESAAFSAGTLTGMLGGSVLFAFSCAALIHLIYTFVPGRNGNLLYLLIVTALFIVCGGLLPVSWMPAGLRPVIRFSPVAGWQSALAWILYGIRTTAAPLAGLLLTGAVLLIPPFVKEVCHEA